MPLIERPAKVAVPLPSVLAVVLPPAVPLPVPVALALTEVPLERTLLLKASCRRTAGWVARAMPAWAVEDGSVTITSLAGAAGLTVKFEVVTEELALVVSLNARVSV